MGKVKSLSIKLGVWEGKQWLIWKRCWRNTTVKNVETGMKRVTVKGK